MTRHWTRIAALLTLPACAWACTTVTYRPLFPDTMEIAPRKAVEVVALTMKSGDRYEFSPPAALQDGRIRTGAGWTLLRVSRLIEDSGQRLVFRGLEAGPSMTETVVTLAQRTGDRGLTWTRTERGLTVAGPDGPTYLVLERLNEDEFSVTVRARLVGLNIPLSEVARIDSRAEHVSRKKVAIGLTAAGAFAALMRALAQGLAMVAANEYHPGR